MKGKALRRALTADPIRVGAEAQVPLITDTTELITPDTAKTMLQHNTNNRPVNWAKVDEYAEIMRNGGWRLHGQGVMLDKDNNVLTGQKRLWAVIRSGVSVYMRISRGNPSDTAVLIDRGTPQSSRDLAARQTGRKHSPTEASIARAICVLQGTFKPSTDDLAMVLAEQADNLAAVVAMTKGGVKTKGTLMILAAAIVHRPGTLEEVVKHTPILVDKLAVGLKPRTPEECWGRGAAFSLALEDAKNLVLAYR